MMCWNCDGEGQYLDAPQQVLDGRPYRETCPVCQGTGVIQEQPMADEQDEVVAEDASVTLDEAATTPDADVPVEVEETPGTEQP